MQKKEAIVVAVDRLGGIAAALETMRNVKLQLRVPRIGSVQDLVQLFRMLTQRSHVIVVAKGYAEIGGPLADLCDHPPQTLVICGGNRVILRLLVRYLKVEPTHVTHKPGIGGMF